MGAWKRLVSSVDLTAPALSPLAEADAVLLIEHYDSVDLFVGGDVGEGTPRRRPESSRPQPAQPTAAAHQPRPRAPANPATRTSTTPTARTRAPAHAPPPPAPVCRRDADFRLKSQVLQQKVASQRGAARREGGNARENARGNARGNARVLPRTGPIPRTRTRTPRLPVPVRCRDADFCLKSQVLQQKVASRWGTR